MDSKIPEPQHCGQDGDQFFCMLYNDVAESIQGWGDTAEAARKDYETQWMLAHSRAGEAWDDSSPKADEIIPIVELVKADLGEETKHGGVE